MPTLGVPAVGRPVLVAQVFHARLGHQFDVGGAVHLALAAVDHLRLVGTPAPNAALISNPINDTFPVRQQPTTNHEHCFGASRMLPNVNCRWDFLSPEENLLLLLNFFDEVKKK